MRRLDEIKEKYKDGWWEGYDGYTGDDMYADIEFMLSEIDRITQLRLSDEQLTQIREKAESALCNDYLIEFAPEGAALIEKDIPKLLAEIERLKRKEYKQQQEDTHEDYVSDIMASIRFD